MQGHAGAWHRLWQLAIGGPCVGPPVGSVGVCESIPLIGSSLCLVIKVWVARRTCADRHSGMQYPVMGVLPTTPSTVCDRLY